MDPFKHMHEWKENMDSFFGGQFWNEFEHMVKPPIPAINMYETDHEVFLYVSLPGIKDKQHVKIMVEGNSLKLTGSLFPIQQTGRLVKQEILQGEFSRSIELPFPIRKDKITASLHQGLLTMHLHRLVPNQDDRQSIDIMEADE